MRLTISFLIAALVSSVALAQDADPGRRLFETRCALCHGADGNGGDTGPPIAQRLATRDDAQLATLIREGLPGRGMPPNPVAGADMGSLVRFLRSIQRRAVDRDLVRMKLQTTSGKTLDGFVLGEGFDDLQLQTAD